MRIKGVAFDLEGTIVDVEFVHHQAHLDAAHDIGVHLDLETAIRDLPHFIGGPDEAVAQEIVALSGSKSSIEEVLQRKRAYYKQIIAGVDAIAPREGFVDVFRWFERNGFAVAIGSSTPRVQAQLLLERSGVGLLFDPRSIVLREDVNSVKPMPDIYIETAGRMGVKPSNQLVFEDSVVGVRAGRAAGSQVVALPTVTTRIFQEQLVDAGVYRIFQSWLDIDIEKLLLELEGL